MICPASKNHSYITFYVKYHNKYISAAINQFSELFVGYDRWVVCCLCPSENMHITVQSCVHKAVNQSGGCSFFIIKYHLLPTNPLTYKNLQTGVFVHPAVLPVCCCSSLNWFEMCCCIKSKIRKCFYKNSLS